MRLNFAFFLLLFCACSAEAPKTYTSEDSIIFRTKEELILEKNRLETTWNGMDPSPSPNSEISKSLNLIMECIRVYPEVPSGIILSELKRIHLIYLDEQKKIEQSQDTQALGVFLDHFESKKKKFAPHFPTRNKMNPNDFHFPEKKLYEWIKEYPEEPKSYIKALLNN